MLDQPLIEQQVREAERDGEHDQEDRQRVATTGLDAARVFVASGALIQQDTRGTARQTISAAAGEQQSGISQINEAVTHMDSITQQNAAKRPDRVFRHRLGGKGDALVWEEKDELFNLSIGTTRSDAWIIATITPDYADGIVPLACVPAQIAGRNRMLRAFAEGQRRYPKDPEPTLTAIQKIAGIDRELLLGLDEFLPELLLLVD